jgi:hypothetical protein
MVRESKVRKYDGEEESRERERERDEREEWSESHDRQTMVRHARVLV